MARREPGFRLGMFHSNVSPSQLALTAALWYMTLLGTHRVAVMGPPLAPPLSVSQARQVRHPPANHGLSPEHVSVLTHPAPMSLSWFPDEETVTPPVLSSAHSTHDFLHICVPKIPKAEKGSNRALSWWASPSYAIEACAELEQREPPGLGERRRLL